VIRRSACVAGWLVTCAALSACTAHGVPVRDLHRVEGREVHSRPPSPRAYESYLRARVALERGDLATAQREIVAAVTMDPTDPHLWTTRAEVELATGRADAARRSVARALALRSGYPPAQRLLARLGPSGVTARR
jgi:Tfp pilus assembly protein PilF